METQLYDFEESSSDALTHNTNMNPVGKLVKLSRRDDGIHDDGMVKEAANDEKQEYLLYEGDNLIGNGQRPGVDIVIEEVDDGQSHAHSSISDVHAILIALNGVFTLKDLASQFGTFYEVELHSNKFSRILRKQTIRLFHETRIKFGNCLCRFELLDLDNEYERLRNRRNIYQEQTQMLTDDFIGIDYGDGVVLPVNKEVDVMNMTGSSSLEMPTQIYDVLSATQAQLALGLEKERDHELSHGIASTSSAKKSDEMGIFGKPVVHKRTDSGESGVELPVIKEVDVLNMTGSSSLEMPTQIYDVLSGTQAQLALGLEKERDHGLSHGIASTSSAKKSDEMGIFGKPILHKRMDSGEETEDDEDIVSSTAIPRNRMNPVRPSSCPLLVMAPQISATNIGYESDSNSSVESTDLLAPLDVVNGDNNVAPMYVLGDTPDKEENGDLNSRVICQSGENLAMDLVAQVISPPPTISISVARHPSPNSSTAPTPTPSILRQRVSPRSQPRFKNLLSPALNEFLPAVGAASLTPKSSSSSLKSEESMAIKETRKVEKRKIVVEKSKKRRKFDLCSDESESESDKIAQSVDTVDKKGGVIMINQLVTPPPVAVTPAILLADVPVAESVSISASMAEMVRIQSIGEELGNSPIIKQDSKDSSVKEILTLPTIAAPAVPERRGRKPVGSRFIENIPVSEAVTSGPTVEASNEAADNISSELLVGNKETATDSQTGDNDENSSLTASSKVVKKIAPVKRGRSVMASSSIGLSSSSSAGMELVNPEVAKSEVPPAKKSKDDLSNEAMVITRQLSSPSVRTNNISAGKSVSASAVKIFFTGLVEDAALSAAAGVEIVQRPEQATHLITGDDLKRTPKLMMAINCGVRYVVNLQWLADSAQKKSPIPISTLTSKYIIRDRAKERLWGFSLAETLQKPRGPFAGAGGSTVFNGYYVFVTKGVCGVSAPPDEDYRAIVESGGGVWMKSLTSSLEPLFYASTLAPPGTVSVTSSSSSAPSASEADGIVPQSLNYIPFVSSRKDMLIVISSADTVGKLSAAEKKAAKAGAGHGVYSSDLIFLAVLRQQFNFEESLLSDMR